jgi:hypothetical protein
MELMSFLFIALLIVGVPTGIVIHEKDKAVNKTTIECIEKPNVCKARYQYLKLGEKLEKIKFEEVK